MLPDDNIDDLFRRQLDGHATPPGDDLWARLQNSAPQPEAHDPHLDELFQKGLGPHATPPRRELWERLEDEHLRQRQRRAAAWWPMAMAAAVLVLLLAGGAGLWLGFPFGKMGGSAVAVQKNEGTNTASKKLTVVATKLNATATPTATNTATPTPISEEAIADNNTPAGIENTVSYSVQKNTTAQATCSLALASTASKASKSAGRLSPRHPLGSTRQPDAAAPSPTLVVRTTPPTPARQTAADEQRPAPVVAANPPTPAPATVIDPARLVPAPELITVEVRNGEAPARPARTVASALAANPEPAERRRLGGRLLEQAGHLVRGERVSLAEVTGLPENVTIQATVAGHRVTKSIQL
ncbi:cytoskeletal protein RodZ [Hymenobacter sp. UYAg731]